MSYLVATPGDLTRKDVKTKLRHLITWPNLVCPCADPMLVWLSWYVIVSDDQAGKPESFPNFTVMSISGAHHRQFRPGWTFADSTSAKQPNFPLDSLPASTRLTSDATRDVQESELCPFGVIGLHKVFVQQLFTLRRCGRGASNITWVTDGNGRQSSPTVGTYRPRHFITIANTSRQSAFAHEDAARRALAS